MLRPVCPSIRVLVGNVADNVRSSQRGFFSFAIPLGSAFFLSAFLGSAFRLSIVGWLVRFARGIGCGGCYGSVCSFSSCSLFLESLNSGLQASADSAGLIRCGRLVRCCHCIFGSVFGRIFWSILGSFFLAASFFSLLSGFSSKERLPEIFLVESASVKKSSAGRPSAALAPGLSASFHLPSTVVSTL